LELEKPKRRRPPVRKLAGNIDSSSISCGGYAHYAASSRPAWQYGMAVLPLSFVVAVTAEHKHPRSSRWLLVKVRAILQIVDVKKSKNFCSLFVEKLSEISRFDCVRILDKEICSDECMYHNGFFCAMRLFHSSIHQNFFYVQNFSTQVAYY
jgi:hypothetical protein